MHSAVHETSALKHVGGSKKEMLRKPNALYTITKEWHPSFWSSQRFSVQTGLLKTTRSPGDASSSTPSTKSHTPAKWLYLSLTRNSTQTQFLACSHRVRPTTPCSQVWLVSPMNCTLTPLCSFFFPAVPSPVETKKNTKKN